MKRDGQGDGRPSFLSAIREHPRGSVAEVVGDPIQADQLEAAERERELRKMWLSKDVFCAVFLAVFLTVAIWVGLSSGIDYFHLGHSECVFSHDRYSHMDLKCGSAPVSNSGDAVGNSGDPSGNSGAPLSSVGSSVYSPPGLP